MVDLDYCYHQISLLPPPQSVPGKDFVRTRDCLLSRRTYLLYMEGTTDSSVHYPEKVKKKKKVVI